MQYAINLGYSQIVGGGTKPKLDSFCVLARGYPQFPGVLGLSRKPKISQIHF